MKTIAFLANGVWCCILVDVCGGETKLFQAASVDEVYQNLKELGLYPYYPVEFRNHTWRELSMKIIERETIVEGMGYHGMSIVLRQLRNGYGVYYYIHCEGRYSEAMTTTDEAEAREYFRREVKTARIKQAIINAARNRVAAGASRDHIEAYKQRLLQVWQGVPDITNMLHYLDRIVFEVSA